jgi:hypothetical protein
VSTNHSVPAHLIANVKGFWADGGFPVTNQFALLEPSRFALRERRTTLGSHISYKDEAQTRCLNVKFLNIQPGTCWLPRMLH